MINQEFTSAGTSINSAKVPALFSKVDWMPLTKNLDWGGGKYDTASDFLKTKSVENIIYDPYNRSEEANAFALNCYDYDTVTISNVLNVIKEAEIRINLVSEALTHLKSNGTLYITVYEGDRSGFSRKSKSGCWQENRRLNSYLEELAQFNPLIKKGMLIIKKV